MGQVADALALAVLYALAILLVVRFARRPGGLACPRELDLSRLPPAQRLAVLEQRRDDLAREIAALRSAPPQPADERSTRRE